MSQGDDKSRPPPETPTTQVSFDSVVSALEARRSLLVYHRNGSQMVGLCDGQSLVVGRASPADVVVPDSSLSREHACFELAGEELTVRDLSSTNGTWINGKRIKSRTRLRAGDEIRLGSITVALHAIDPAAAGLALQSCDDFLERLQEEVVRARTFHQGTALLLVQAAQHKQSHLSHWFPRVQRLLRAVDRTALYGPTALLVCVPRADREEALRLARSIVDGRARSEPPLLVGAACFPEDAASADELVEAARTACQSATPREPVQTVHDARHVATGGPIFVSLAMQDLHRTALRVADTLVPVLIAGETGTGKEILARVMHQASSRREGPMRCLNCGAIPEHLVESTLFGHERGAFTGADRQASGLFEDSAGGTVLLDEIGELPLPAQTALLRVIETRRVSRVGSSQEITVDVRVIAATNRDLEAMAAQGEFRSDLLFRLNAITLKIPPLRQRPEDIGPLAEHFMAEAVRSTGRRISGIEPAAVQALKQHEWPGNVRELRNVIERAVVLASEDRITVDDLSERVRSTARGDGAAVAPGGDEGGFAIKERLRRYEAQIIVEALRAHEGNQTKAAKALGISRRSLVEKIRTLGIRKRYDGQV